MLHRRETVREHLEASHARYIARKEKETANPTQKPDQKDGGKEKKGEKKKEGKKK
jgi:hypothetical protein